MRTLTTASLFLLSSPAFACANTMHGGESAVGATIFLVAAAGSALLFLGALGMAGTAGYLAWKGR